MSVSFLQQELAWFLQFYLNIYCWRSYSDSVGFSEVKQDDSSKEHSTYQQHSCSSHCRYSQSVRSFHRNLFHVVVQLAAVLYDMPILYVMGDQLSTF